MARPDVTCPPGVFRYNEISALLSFDARNSNWAWIMFATSSSIGTPKKMILSIIRRENTSMDATLSFLSSIMVGLMYELTVDS